MFLRQVLTAALIAAPLAWNPADLAAQQRGPAPQASSTAQGAPSARGADADASQRPDVPSGVDKAFEGKDLPAGIQRAFPNARPEAEPEPLPAPEPEPAPAPEEPEECEITFSHFDPITSLPVFVDCHGNVAG